VRTPERRVKFIFEQIRRGKNSDEILTALESRAERGRQSRRRGLDSEAKTIESISDLEIVSKIVRTHEASRDQRKKGT